MSLEISDKVKAAQEALALLRQETTLAPNCLGENYSGRTKLETACYRAFDYALAAFNDLHNWPANDPLAYAAFVVFLARELCIPVSGRDEDLKALDALFNQRLQRARLHALKTEVAAEDDPLNQEVLARILAEFTDDQKMLAFKVEAYTARIENVKATVLAAINNAHVWRTDVSGNPSPYLENETLPGTLKAAYVAGICAEIATSVGVSDARAKSWADEYTALLNTARTNALNDALAANEDPVLAELLANFAENDPAKPKAFSVYTARGTAIKADAVREINAAHEWSADFANTEAGKSHVAYPAFVALCVARLANACGLREAAQNLQARYLLLLQRARMHALADAVNATQTASDNNADPLLKEALARILSEFADDDKALAFRSDAWGQRVDAVKATVLATINGAHVWRTAANGDPSPYAANELPDDLKECYVLGVCAAIGPAMGVDPQVAAVWIQRHDALLARARAAALNAALAGNTDPALAELLGNFAEDDKALARSFGIYSARAAAVKADVLAAINDAHDWGATYAEADLPGSLKECFALGVCARLAIACGLTEQTAQRYAQLYEAKLARARVAQLHRMLAAQPDPVLAELLANFKADDAGLAWMFDIYTARIDAVRDMARRAILASHHWGFARKTATFDGTRPDDCIRVLKVTDADGRPVAWSAAGDAISADEDAATVVYTADIPLTAWPPLPFAAYVSAAAAEIAAAVASPDAKTLFERTAADRLVRARVADLNEDGSGAPIVRDVKAVLKAEYRATDQDLDESADAIAARIADLLDAARKEVMSAHRWNFARVSLPLRAAPGPDGTALAHRPGDCVRIEAVKTPRGDLADWSVRGDLIAAHGPIASVTYIRDEPDISLWPPDVRRCLVYRLAADAASSVPSRGKDPSALFALYERTLASAAVQNAREANPGRAAWGRSRYVDAMLGSDFPHRRPRVAPIPHRH